MSKINLTKFTYSFGEMSRRRTLSHSIRTWEKRGPRTNGKSISYFKPENADFSKLVGKGEILRYTVKKPGERVFIPTPPNR